MSERHAEVKIANAPMQRISSVPTVFEEERSSIAALRLRDDERTPHTLPCHPVELANLTHQRAGSTPLQCVPIVDAPSAPKLDPSIPSRSHACRDTLDDHPPLKLTADFAPRMSSVRR